MFFICELPILVKHPDLHVYPSLLDEDQVLKMGRGVVHMRGYPSPRRAILKYTDLQNTDIHFGAPTFVVFGYVYKHYRWLLFTLVLRGHHSCWKINFRILIQKVEGGIISCNYLLMCRVL